MHRKYKKKSEKETLKDLKPTFTQMIIKNDGEEYQIHSPSWLARNARVRGPYFHIALLLPLSSAVRQSILTRMALLCPPLEGNDNQCVFLLVSMATQDPDPKTVLGTTNFL